MTCTQSSSTYSRDNQTHIRIIFDYSDSSVPGFRNTGTSQVTLGALAGRSSVSMFSLLMKIRPSHSSIYFHLELELREGMIENRSDYYSPAGESNFVNIIPSVTKGLRRRPVVRCPRFPTIPVFENERPAKYPKGPCQSSAPENDRGPPRHFLKVFPP
jgi:hypothetical protein